jgi:hypothetical protein
MGGNNSKQQRQKKQAQQQAYYWAPNDDGIREPENFVSTQQATDRNPTESESPEENVLNNENTEQEDNSNEQIEEDQQNHSFSIGEDSASEGEDSASEGEDSASEGEDSASEGDNSASNVEPPIESSKNILNLVKELQVRDNDQVENTIRIENIIRQNNLLSDKYLVARKEIGKFRESGENTIENMCEVFLRNKKLKKKFQILLEKKQEGENVFLNEIRQIIQGERANAAQVKESINKHRNLNNKRMTLEEEIKRKQNEIEHLHALIEDKKHELKIKRQKNLILENAHEIMGKEIIIKDHIIQMIRKEIKERNKEFLNMQPIMYFQATFYKMEYEIENAFRDSFGAKV